MKNFPTYFAQAIKLDVDRTHLIIDHSNRGTEPQKCKPRDSSKSGEQDAEQIVLENHRKQLQQILENYAKRNSVIGYC